LAESQNAADPLEEIMKLSSLMMTVLAVGLATPVLAQQAPVSGDQQPQNQELRQQVEQLAQRWRDSYNGKDAQALANLYTEDAAVSFPNWTANGRQEIRQDFETEFREGGMTNLQNAVGQVQTLDDSHAWANGSWKANRQRSMQQHQAASAERTGSSGSQGGAQPADGHWLIVLVRDGSEWKVRANVSNMNMPELPAEAIGTSTPPSSHGSMR
jgi:uncharacterized protein (TIGR02246 family)